MLIMYFTGYAGVNCEVNINECLLPNSCQHGECIDGINSFTCNCTNTGESINPFTPTDCFGSIQNNE